MHPKEKARFLISHALFVVFFAGTLDGASGKRTHLIFRQNDVDKLVDLKDELVKELDVWVQERKRKAFDKHFAPLLHDKNGSKHEKPTLLLLLNSTQNKVNKTVPGIPKNGQF